MIVEQLRLKEKHLAMDLPQAVIHGDLFRDNILFFDGEISGVIDFYNAGTDSLLLDMAIVVNDWCIDAEGLVDAVKRSGFLQAYESQRDLSCEEHEHWQRPAFGCCGNINSCCFSRGVSSFLKTLKLARGYYFSI